MNIEKIKQFIEIRNDLSKSGVIGLSLYADEIHMLPEVLANEQDLTLKIRQYDEYPYEISTIRDGIKIFCIANKENLAKFFPQFLEIVEKEKEELA